MTYEKSELYFLLALLGIVGIITFLIFQPFLTALILAVIFATVFEPVHKKVLAITRQSRGLSAFITTILFLMVIVVPVAFLSTQILKEATQLYSSLVDNGGTVNILQGFEAKMTTLGIPFSPTTPLDVSQYLKGGLNYLIQNFGTIFSNVAKIILDIFILLIAIFFLFRDGVALKKSVIAFSPLKDMYDETIFKKLELAINSVVRGSISIALMHGILSTIGFTIFGVPNPILWGSMTAITALVPGFGTTLIYIPILFFQFSFGVMPAAIGLFIWWVAELNIVDNFIGPKIMRRGVKIHPFLILLSIFGGIGLFGPVGFLFGPLVLSLLLAFLEIYKLMRKGSSL